MASTQRPVIVGVTGASGTIYGRRLVEALVRSGTPVELIVSAAGRRVWHHELEEKAPTADSPEPATVVHAIGDIGATIASGSYLTRGMIVAPCSMGTLGRIAGGAASNLIERAADVVLKERRRLILVPRDAPLSRIHLENMLRLTDAGAIVMPACPSFYRLRPGAGIEGLADTVVARILDLLEIEHDLIERWSGDG